MWCYEPDRLWDAQHPAYVVMSTKLGQRIWRKLFMACQRTADRLIGRVLLEAVQWALAKPDEILIAYVEAERRLRILIDDSEVGPFVWPYLCGVSEAIGGLWDRIERGELEARMID